MAKNNRDEFPPAVKADLAKQVGWLCSNPDCRTLTTGPHENRKKSVNIGVAAHICAASPGKGAKRYDPNQKPEERMGIENGIWLCQTHAKLIDSDEFRYSPELLHEWKRLAMDHARDTIEKPNKLAGRPNYKRWIRVLVPPVAICALLAAVILPNGSFGLTPTEKKAQAMEAHLEKYKEFMATHKGIILAQFVVMDKINDLKSWEHAKANGSLKALASLIEKQSSLLATKEAVELFSGMELVVPCLKDLERLPEVDKQEEAYRSWRQTVDAMPIKGPQTDAQVKEWTEKVRVLLFACLNWNTASVKSVEGAIRKCIAELK